jgi:hypothetical protein
LSRWELRCSVLTVYKATNTCSISWKLFMKLCCICSFLSFVENWKLNRCMSEPRFSVWTFQPMIEALYCKHVFLYLQLVTSMIS